MKFLVVQSHVNGPWRWCIEDHGVVVAACPPGKAYRREGMAVRDLRDFLRRLIELADGDAAPIESRPSVQIPLFDFALSA